MILLIAISAIKGLRLLMKAYEFDMLLEILFGHLRGLFVFICEIFVEFSTLLFLLDLFFFPRDFMS
jgi:hypothetical protein